MPSINCSNCQAVIEQTYEFCPKCGAKTKAQNKPDIKNNILSRKVPTRLFTIKITIILLVAFSLIGIYLVLKYNEDNPIHKSPVTKTNEENDKGLYVYPTLIGSLSIITPDPLLEHLYPDEAPTFPTLVMEKQTYSMKSTDMWIRGHFVKYSNAPNFDIHEDFGERMKQEILITKAKNFKIKGIETIKADRRIKISGTIEINAELVSLYAYLLWNKYSDEVVTIIVYGFTEKGTGEGKKSIDNSQALELEINENDYKIKPLIKNSPLRDRYKIDCVKGVKYTLNEYNITDKSKEAKAKAYCDCIWEKITDEDLLFIEENKNKKVYNQLMEGKYKSLNSKCFDLSLEAR